MLNLAKKSVARASRAIRRLTGKAPFYLLESSAEYWTEHNVTQHRSYASPEESLSHFDWRNDQYIGYLDLMPVAGFDGKAILDYGCGPGHDLVGFGTFSEPAKLYGADVSQSSLEEARLRLSLHDINAKLLQMSEDRIQIPLEDTSIDHIHCSGVLNHITDHQAILAEFFRILKPDGSIRVMVYNYDSIWLHLYVGHVLPKSDDRYRGMDIEESFRRSTDGFDCPVSRNWRVTEMIEMGRSAGFEVTHLGNAISLFEMQILPDRFAAMMDPGFRAESREFLAQLHFDKRGMPIANNQIAGIDGCFELRKTDASQ